MWGRSIKLYSSGSSCVSPVIAIPCRSKDLPHNSLFEDELSVSLHSSLLYRVSVPYSKTATTTALYIFILILLDDVHHVITCQNLCTTRLMEVICGYYLLFYYISFSMRNFSLRIASLQERLSSSISFKLQPAPFFWTWKKVVWRVKRFLNHFFNIFHKYLYNILYSYTITGYTLPPRQSIISHSPDIQLNCRQHEVYATYESIILITQCY